MKDLLESSEIKRKKHTYKNYLNKTSIIDLKLIILYYSSETQTEYVLIK